MWLENHFSTKENRSQQTWLKTSFKSNTPGCTYHRHIHFIPKKFNFQNCQFCQHTIVEQYWMYSTLPTLNNKKITAMFYVHLFLKAMYRKTERKKRKINFPKTCLRVAVWSVEAAGSRCIVGRRTVWANAARKRKKHRQKNQRLRPRWTRRD